MCERKQSKKIISDKSTLGEMKLEKIFEGGEGHA